MALPESAAELTTYIEGRYHVRHREQLPELRNLSAKVETVHAISVMRADHDDHLGEISKIRTLTNDLTLPDNACGSWRRLYSGLQEFLTDIEEHIRIENDVLFPQFEKDRQAAR